MHYTNGKTVMRKMNSSCTRHGTAMLMACILFLGGSALAQSQSADAQRIVDALKPDPSPVTSPVMKTRGLRNLQVEQTVQAIEKPSVPKSVSLTIGFKFDSALITPDSAQTLGSLVQALKSNELGEMAFMIEGHTDGKGSADYNLRLSHQRAIAVKNHLEQAGVDPKRLQSQGKGDTELVNAHDRFAAENRRVKVITLPQ